MSGRGEAVPTGDGAGDDHRRAARLGVVGEEGVAAPPPAATVRGPAFRVREGPPAARDPGGVAHGSDPTTPSSFTPFYKDRPPCR